MLADRLIERNSIFLRNNNAHATHDLDAWVSGTGYGFYGIPYEKPLVLDHYYYLRCQYKFTTTNQSPTWFTMYFQGGGNGGPSVSGLTAGTTYTVSGIRQPAISRTSYPITAGTMYNGDSNKINGVTSYVRNVVVYDVTELYYALLAKGAVTDTDTLKTWCDSNLEYRKTGINYDITSLVADSNEKVVVKGGNMIATNFIECDGMQYYSINSTIRANTYFDNSTGVYVYNNNGNGTVTFERVGAQAQGSPFYPKHPYVLKITTNGSAAPYAGGFYTNHVAAANKIFVEKFVAKIPVGYSVTCHYNSQGSGASVSWISSTAGTGKWEEYTVLYKCGSSGSFSTGGHIALSGSNNTSVTWYVAYVNDCDITGKEYLKYYTALPTKTVFNGGNVNSYSLTNNNLIPNGDCSSRPASFIPGSWTYDTSDVPPNSNAKASIVQPVGAGSGGLNYVVRISPTTRYKISYWVKCKQDMSSFLTALHYRTESDHTYTHISTCYRPGTVTTLSEALVSGATQVKVASNANWAAQSYSNLGFRSGGTWAMCTYNDIGTATNGSTGMVQGISGSDIILLNTAYTGNTIPSGTAIVETYDGGNYPYPISKGMLPTDNTWKYVEGYFGQADTLWNGSNTWGPIPGEARKLYIQLNLYANNGSVPIKYADIKVEPIAGTGCERYESKIQLETKEGD